MHQNDVVLYIIIIIIIIIYIGSAPSGYVDFKFISLSLAIVCIDCTIVRVIEPQRLLVVLRNKISKGTYLT
jgi:hypothetical protein